MVDEKLYEKPAPIPLLPDPAIGISDMKDFGYEWEDMLPLTESWALELYDSNNTVYLLYPDNTEGMVLDREEISNHKGIFGIELQEWKQTSYYAKQLADVSGKEARLESELLHDTGNRFGIYQIADGIDETRNFRFASMRELEALGLGADRANYELVHSAPFSLKVEFLSDRYPILNNIYNKFNTDPPDGYAGRSVSVSDVIALKYNGDISVHYVDSAGFVELDNYAFFGEDTNRQQAAYAPAPTKEPESLSQVGTDPDNSDGAGQPAEASRTEVGGPTVAELEAEVKAGKSISLRDLARAVNAEKSETIHAGAPKTKPKLMERLEEGKQKAAQQGQPDSNKNKQREVK
jgi:hypothetical protein